jgi:isoquinoline 1-oxidoreductase alpha subunit
MAGHTIFIAARAPFAQGFHGRWRRLRQPAARPAGLEVDQFATGALEWRHGTLRAGRPSHGESTVTTFTLNGSDFTFDGDPETPLLWVIREAANLTGTKYGCGIAQCGACTVHINGATQRSCVTPVSGLDGADVVTIEGLEGPEWEAVRNAWIAIDVPQCGYCQSGQVMSAVSLLQLNPKPTDADIDGAMAGNICRCATYQRIRQAIHDAAGTLEG